jgi:hypothetical protein
VTANEVADDRGSTSYPHHHRCGGGWGNYCVPVDVVAGAGGRLALSAALRQRLRGEVRGKIFGALKSGRLKVLREI